MSKSRSGSLKLFRPIHSDGKGEKMATAGNKSGCKEFLHFLLRCRRKRASNNPHLLPQHGERERLSTTALTSFLSGNSSWLLHFLAYTSVQQTLREVFPIPPFFPVLF